METIKVENFLKCNVGGSFPRYESLDRPASAAVRSLLCQRLALASNVDSLTLVRSIDALGKVLKGVDARDEEFRLIDTLRAAQIEPLDFVYVNWYRYDDLDRLRIDELNEVFKDIWYPGADDVDLFDDTLSWVLSIAHNGMVKLVIG